MVNLLEYNPQGWCFGISVSSGEQGIFPGNFIELCPSETKQVEESLDAYHPDDDLAELDALAEDLLNGPHYQGILFAD